MRTNITVTASKIVTRYDNRMSIRIYFKNDNDNNGIFREDDLLASDIILTNRHYPNGYVLDFNKNAFEFLEIYKHLKEKYGIEAVFCEEDFIGSNAMTKLEQTLLIRYTALVLSLGFICILAAALKLYIVVSIASFIISAIMVVCAGKEEKWYE